MEIYEIKIGGILMEKKIVLITGGGTGIGEAIAKAFCKNGYEVYILGRRKEKLEKVCEDSSNSINYFVCDINNDNDIKQILGCLRTAFYCC